MFLTASPESIFSPVMGQIPPLARVAAITDAASTFVSTEQHCESGSKNITCVWKFIFQYDVGRLSKSKIGQNVILSTRRQMANLFNKLKCHIILLISINLIISFGKILSWSEKQNNSFCGRHRKTLTSYSWIKLIHLIKQIQYNKESSWLLDYLEIELQSLVEDCFFWEAL